LDIEENESRRTKGTIPNMDCECRKKWENRLRNLMAMALASLEEGKAKLIDFSHAKYMEITQKLTLDVRIFFGTNSVIIVLLLLISFMKPAAISHLFLSGGLLLTSTLLSSSYFYLFEQNWCTPYSTTTTPVLALSGIYCQQYATEMGPRPDM
jgi:hypothetical protein